ncbi:class I SAM-dependent methyltransferase [Streptomyces diastaticus]
MKGAAQRMTASLEEITGGPLPFRLRAWDGSESGPADPSGTLPVVVVRHRRALRRLLWSPGELGLAQAYDAVTAIETGEHVGDAAYPAFTRLIHDRLRPGGRALVQQMSRGAHAPGGGAFIETHIAPDMHMRPLGETVGLLEGAGPEVRHTESLREHYVRTGAAWAETLEARWDEAVALVGEVTARVWRLYLAGGGLAFDQRRMGVDQVLAVRPGRDGAGGPPVTPAGWYGSGEAAR